LLGFCVSHSNPCRISSHVCSFGYPFLKMLAVHVERFVHVDCHTHISPLTDCSLYNASEIVQYLPLWIWVMMSALEEGVPLVIE
jgi:hypothetical protein